MNKGPALAVALMIPAAFAAGAWAQSQREQRAATVDRSATIANHTSSEDAALTMLRMGAEDWILSCAWQLGKEGQPRDAMCRACTVDWNIGEIKDPERRRPRPS